MNHLETESYTRAFNAGCDARLAGKSLRDNPHGSGQTWYSAWRYGWLDVERNWGIDAKRPVAELPALTRSVTV